jgi:hypothetical protein
MKKSLTVSFVHFSFYFSVLLGVIMNFMDKDKTQYSFPPNMGWIIIFGFLCLIFKE